MVVETEVAEEHGSAEEEGGRVGLVLALDVETDVAAAGLEHGHVAAHVAAGNNTGSTDQGGGDVGEDTTVQVGHDEHVELLGLADALHGGVVDDHVVAGELGVVLGEVLEGAAEETIGQLHDVGLVDHGHLLTVVGEGEGEGELDDALRLGAGDDLERLDDAGDALMLEAAVLTLGVLSDDAHVDVLVAGLEAGDVLDQSNRGVDVELLTHGDVEALVALAADGRVQDSLQAELVALERADGLVEEVLGPAADALDAGDVNLLPLNGDVVGLEDGLDALGHLGADTITGDEGDGVLATVLGGLEDVGLDRLDGSGILDRSEGACGIQSHRWLGCCPQQALLAGGGKLALSIFRAASQLRPKPST